MNKNSSYPIAAILKNNAGELYSLSIEQKKVVRAITLCRTSGLGGHVSKCDTCGCLEVFYNSCRNRHCPNCQFLEKERWILAREKELLPVSYFHIVFTAPGILADILLWNKERCFSLFFKAVSETIKEVALRKKNLGAKAGFIAVLHTWTQKLLFHPHLHCIVPGGGIDPDTGNWVHSATNYFLPLTVLSKVFRAKFLKSLFKAHKQSKLFISPESPVPSDVYNFKHFLYASCKHNWVVYAKRPFAGPKQVINYLSRYTHRIAISNQRIVSYENNKVTFWYRDRKDNNRKKQLTIDAADFTKRFLLHVLPHGFMKIRYYGFLGSPQKNNAIMTIRIQLGVTIDDKEHDTKQTWVDLMVSVTGTNPHRCKQCGKGNMVLFRTLFPGSDTS